LRCFGTRRDVVEAVFPLLWGVEGERRRRRSTTLEGRRGGGRGGRKEREDGDCCRGHAGRGGGLRGRVFERESWRMGGGWWSWWWRGEADREEVGERKGGKDTASSE